jgi:hypothetical protein
MDKENHFTKQNRETPLPRGIVLEKLIRVEVPSTFDIAIASL